ncbi:PREDICTED: syndetin-like, partial [Priapulus caudatus]|uniref:Syndetin-like n=1 Tax=Priapulus caudatus TaxID=37621 RepID=A0ABM1F6I9_PRICU
MQIGEEFCGSDSEFLQESIRKQSVNYFRTYHRGRMEELRMFVENEGWEPCPVKASFSILHLQEFKFLRASPLLQQQQQQQQGSVASVQVQILLHDVLARILVRLDAERVAGFEISQEESILLMLCCRVRTLLHAATTHDIVLIALPS